MKNPDAILNELIGRPCVGAIAQSETGGNLLLDFGGWQEYQAPQHGRLQSTERGKWTLMIECPWRLDGSDMPVSDWRCVADSERKDSEAHLVLEGLCVEELAVRRPGLDLTIRLSRGYVLRISCDSDAKSAECWYLIRPDGSSLSATRDYQLVWESPRSQH